MSISDNTQLDLFINEPPVGGRALLDKPTIRWVVIVRLERNWHEVEEAIRHRRIEAAYADSPHLMSQEEFELIPLDMQAYDGAILDFTMYSADEYREALLADKIRHNYGACVRNCALCGGGLDLTHCHACRARFRDDAFNIGWDVPLPLKVIDALQARGHQFMLNPLRLYTIG